MRYTVLVRGTIVTLAALAVVTTGALAQLSNKQGVWTHIDPNNPKAVEACKEAGGVVSKDRSGGVICANARHAIQIDDDTGATAPTPPRDTAWTIATIVTVRNGR